MAAACRSRVSGLPEVAGSPVADESPIPGERWALRLGAEQVNPVSLVVGVNSAGGPGGLSMSGPTLPAASLIEGRRCLNRVEGSELMARADDVRSVNGMQPIV